MGAGRIRYVRVRIWVFALVPQLPTELSKNIGLAAGLRGSILCFAAGQYITQFESARACIAPALDDKAKHCVCYVKGRTIPMLSQTGSLLYIP